MAPRILVCYDCSTYSKQALIFASMLSKAFNVEKVTVLCVKPPYIGEEHIRKRVENELKELGLKADIVIKDFEPMSYSPVQVIMDEIEHGGYDIVIVSSKGFTTRDDVRIGSVALWLAANAPTTVIIVR